MHQPYIVSKGNTYLTDIFQKGGIGTDHKTCQKVKEIHKQLKKYKGDLTDIKSAVSLLLYNFILKAGYYRNYRKNVDS